MRREESKWQIAFLEETFLGRSFSVFGIVVALSLIIQTIPVAFSICSSVFCTMLALTISFPLVNLVLNSTILEYCALQYSITIQSSRRRVRIPKQIPPILQSWLNGPEKMGGNNEKKRKKNRGIHTISRLCRESLNTSSKTSYSWQ